MAEYVKFDDLKWDYLPVQWEKKYDLPNDLIDTWKKYETYKLTPYKNLSAEQIQEMNDISQDLRVYTIEAEDYNKCFDLMANVQSFIKDELPDYINECLTEVWKQVNSAIEDTSDLKEEISDWWTTLKLSIQLNKTFVWDNWLALPNVDYYTTQFSDKKIVETLKFKNTSFGTYTTILADNSITETIVITDPYDSTIVYNRTKTTIFNSNGSIKESIVDNI